MRAVNLLTPELRSAQKGPGSSRPSIMETSGGLGAFIVMGVLALCVVGVAGSVLATNGVNERKASLAEITSESEQTVKRAAELKPYADFQALAQARASTVKALASSRFDWEQSLRDLSRALPSDVYLSSLKGTLGGSGGGSGIRSAIGSPALELSGCTRNHTAVATMMSRLRNVQGVTRVSLAKSEKAAASAGGGGGTVGPCGNNSPPSFEVVIFFEKASVASPLADATGAAPDPTAPGAASAKPASTPAPTPATEGGSTP